MGFRKAEKVLCHPWEGGSPSSLASDCCKVSWEFSGLNHSPLLSNEGIHGEDRCLGWENLLGENPVNFLVGVETGVLEDDASEIQVECPPEGGKSNTTRLNPKEHQVLNAARAENQVEMVLRKCTDALLIDHQFPGASNRTVEFGGWRALYEEIVLLDPLKRGVSIWNFRMAFRKSKSHMDNLELLLSGKFRGFGCIWDNCIRTGDKSQNPFLAIESQQRFFFGSSFIFLPFLLFR